MLRNSNQVAPCRHPAAVIGGAMCLALLAGPALATVTQVTGAGYEQGVIDLFQRDEVFDPVDPVTDTIFSSVSGGFGRATSSAGVFGDLGLEARQTLIGEMRTYVTIENDFVPNLTAGARTAALRFIIDGGQLEMVAGGGSELHFSLSVRTTIYDSDGDFVNAVSWISDATMTQNRGGFDLRRGGQDIGITRSASTPFGIDIPFSFQTIELGAIPAGGYADISYQADIRSDIVDFAEVVRWEFSDPLSVDDTGRAPELFFTDEATPMPVPAAASLFVLGLVLLYRGAGAGRLDSDHSASTSTG